MEKSCINCRWGFRFKSKLLFCTIANDTVSEEFWKHADCCKMWRGVPDDNLDVDNAEELGE